MRIMIASSHDALAHAIGEVLDLDGHEYEWHQDPDQILAHLGAQLFDVCLIDHQIGLVRGATLAQEAANLASEGLRIVLLARTADIGTRSRCEANGVHHLLAKPFDRAQLQAALGAGAST